MFLCLYIFICLFNSGPDAPSNRPETAAPGPPDQISSNAPGKSFEVGVGDRLATLRKNRTKR